MANSFMGFGTSFLGKRGYRSDGSYITTEFVTACWLPLLPLRSFRVLPTWQSSWDRGAVAGESKRYQVLEGFRPLCWVQVASIYATVVLCFGSLVFLFEAIGKGADPGPLYGFTQTPFGGFLLLVCTLWPVYLGSILRLMGRRRAGLR